MFVSASRFALRRSPRHIGRPTARWASTSTSQASEAASTGAAKAKATASAAASKASEGLSRVTSSAGPALSGAAKQVGNALGKVGGRTGRVIALVQSAIPPTVYYSKVGLELSKLVIQGQKMNPPTLATFQSYYQPLLRAVRNPKDISNLYSKSAGNLNPSTVLHQVRNVTTQQLATAGVVAAEVIGFFTVGTMIGKFKVVGYRGGKAEHH